MNLLNFVIVLTVVTAAILVVKKLFGSRITPRGHMIIWLMVAVQFLAWPLAEWLPEADWSLKGYVPQVTEQHQATVHGDEDAHGLSIEDEGAIYEVEKTTVEMKMPLGDQSMRSVYTVERHDADAWRKGIFLLWGVVSGLMAIRLIGGYLWARKRMNRLPHCDEGTAEGRAVMDCFWQMKAAAKVKGKVELRVGAEATMLAGLLRPTVYLSGDLTTSTAGLGAGLGAAGSAALDLAALQCAFAHELTHYRHRDLWLNVAAAAVRCAFWWNPVIWLAFKAFRRDMEVYCDYDAAKLFGDKKEYARTLVKAAAGTDRFVLATTALIGGEKEVSHRVKTLATFKKPKTWVILAALAILLCVCVGLAVNPPSKRSVNISMDDLAAGTLLAYGMNGSGSTKDVEPGRMDTLADLIDALNEADTVSKESEPEAYEAFLQVQKPYPECVGQVWLDIKGGGTHCISYVYGAELDYPVLVELKNGNVLLSRDEKLIREADDLFYESFGTSEGMYRSHKRLSEENLVCDGSLSPEEAAGAYADEYVKSQCIGTSPGGSDWGRIAEFMVRDYRVIQVTKQENVLMGSLDYAFTTEHMEKFSPRKVAHYGHVSRGEGAYADMAVGTTRFVLVKAAGSWYLSEWEPDCWLEAELGTRNYSVPGLLEDGKVYGTELYENVYMEERLLLEKIGTYWPGTVPDRGTENMESNEDFAFELDPEYSGGENWEYWVYSGGKHGGNGGSDGEMIGYRFYYLQGTDEAELWMGVFSRTQRRDWICKEILKLQVM